MSSIVSHYLLSLPFHQAISSQPVSHNTPLVSSPEIIPSTSTLPSQSRNIHITVTQAKRWHHKPKVLLSDLTIMEPSNVHEASVHEKWHAVVYDEYTALVKN